VHSEFRLFLDCTRQGVFVGIEGGWGGVDDSGEGYLFRFVTVMFVFIVVVCIVSYCFSCPGTTDGK